MSEPPTVTLTIQMTGYESRVSFPVTHFTEALQDWLQMQMDQLARWKPGTEVRATERRSLPSPPPESSP